MLGVRSICSPTEKEAVRNKQTDRQVERTQIIPTAASQHCLFPCSISAIHLFKSAFPHSLTVHLTTYSCESSPLKLLSVLNGCVSFHRVSAPPFLWVVLVSLRQDARCVCVCFASNGCSAHRFGLHQCFGVVVKVKKKKKVGAAALCFPARRATTSSICGSACLCAGLLISRWCCSKLVWLWREGPAPTAACLSVSDI